ncbi:MAG: hypothetical protein ACQES1_10265 [Bacteroidota bacterium]
MKERSKENHRQTHFFCGLPKAFSAGITRSVQPGFPLFPIPENALTHYEKMANAVNTHPLAAVSMLFIPARGFGSFDGW